MKPLSSLFKIVPPSPTTMMMQKGRELKAAGHDVVSLAGGEPDFDTPRHIVEAGMRPLPAGDTHYPPSFGTPALLEAIVGQAQAREQCARHYAGAHHGDAGRQMGPLCRAGDAARAGRRGAVAGPVVGQLCAHGPAPSGRAGAVALPSADTSASRQISWRATFRPAPS